MTTMRHLSWMTLARLAMTGRVTMLGIARWTGDRDSYRTVQRHVLQTAETGHANAVLRCAHTTTGLTRAAGSFASRRATPSWNATTSTAPTATPDSSKRNT